MRRKIFLMLTIALSALIFSVTALAQQRFVGSLTGAQEVPANNSSGKGVCTLVLNSTETQMTVNCTFSGLSSPASAGHIHDAGPIGVNGPVRFPFTGVSGTSGTLGPFTFTPTPAQIADLRAKRWYFNIHTTNIPGGEIRGQVIPANSIYDADGDGRTDVTVFRQSTNTFFTLRSVDNSITTNQFGSGTGDNWLNSTGDFDGDGRSDPLLIKLSQTNGDAFWSVLQTGTNTIRTVQWGNFLTTVGDSLVPGDYDGDGKFDIAVFRRSTGVWYILESSTNSQRVVPNFGAANDIPAVGDYDGDGKTDLTVVRGEGTNLIWHTLFSATGQSIRVPWGATADGVFFFVQVDIDGDGKQDRMTQRTVNGQTQFNILRSSDNGQVYLPWGLSTDTKLFGDYDGDGKTDIVARRVVSGQMIWYIYQSSNQQGRTVNFGTTGDQ